MPDAIRHSGILSLQYVRAAGKEEFLFFLDKPRGLDYIQAIADRCMRGRTVRRRDYEALCAKVAFRIYKGAPHQARRVIREHFHSTAARCGDIAFSGLRLDGVPCGSEYSMPRRPIWIQPAPSKPCRWCGTRVELRPSWPEKYTAAHASIHCNKPACRHMHHLCDVPTSRGGINLTPRQRWDNHPDAWDNIRALNYLQLQSKKVKRNER